MKKISEIFFMTVNANYLSQGIYISEWLGIVTAREVQLSQEQVIALREQHQDHLPYVLILDVSQLLKVHLDFQLVRNVLMRSNNQLYAQVIVGASHSARITALGFGTVFQLRYCFTDSLEAAFPLAEAYLAEIR